MQMLFEIIGIFWEMFIAFVDVAMPLLQILGPILVVVVIAATKLKAIPIFILMSMFSFILNIYLILAPVSDTRTNIETGSKLLSLLTMDNIINLIMYTETATFELWHNVVAAFACIGLLYVYFRVANQL